MLRQPNLQDFDAFFAIFSDPQTNIHNPRGPVQDPETAAMRLRSLLEHWEEHGFGVWTVCLRDDDERIVGFGGISYKSIGQEQKLNLSYRFARQVWGKGYATELATYALRHARYVLKIRQVWAVVQAGNTASIRVLEKAGLILAGRLEETPGQATSLVYRNMIY